MSTLSANALVLTLLLSTLSVSMEQVQFDYSMKKIPIPPKQEYHLQLISSVETFMKNIKWRAFHFLNPMQSNQKQTFGFNSTKPAPQVAELKELENELFATYRQHLK